MSNVFELPKQRRGKYHNPSAGHGYQLPPPPFESRPASMNPPQYDDSPACLGAVASISPYEYVLYIHGQLPPKDFDSTTILKSPALVPTANHRHPDDQQSRARKAPRAKWGFSPRRVCLRTKYSYEFPWPHRGADPVPGTRTDKLRKMLEPGDTVQ